MADSSSTKTGRRGRSGPTHEQQGHATAREQRALQDDQEARRRRAAKADDKKKKKPVQPGDRRLPVPKLPRQHLEKPGLETDLKPRPHYLAPTYQGSAKLEDKVALITGGDSGIGRAVAVLFAREGADVAIVYLSEDTDAEETCAAVEAEGRRCLLIPGDVRDSAFCDAAVEQTVAAYGKLDVLVNNAAYQEHQNRLEDLTDEQIDMTFRTNIYGYMYMARAALRYMKRGAVILNSGSITGLQGSGSLLDYAATKGAIHAFTRSLAQNLMERGIRVNAVAPGPIWTPLNPADIPADKVAEFGADTPMGRPGQPDEVAPAYVFLAASSMSSYISGEVMPIVGGTPLGN